MPKNSVVRDNNGVPVGFAPIGIVLVAQDTEILHKAIEANIDIEFYFSGSPATTYTWDAGRPLPVSSNMRLKTSIQCLVY